MDSLLDLKVLDSIKNLDNTNQIMDSLVQLKEWINGQVHIKFYSLKFKRQIILGKPYEYASATPRTVNGFTITGGA